MLVSDPALKVDLDGDGWPHLALKFIQKGLVGSQDVGSGEVCLRDEDSR